MNRDIKIKQKVNKAATGDDIKKVINLTMV